MQPFARPLAGAESPLTRGRLHQRSGCTRIDRLARRFNDSIRSLLAPMPGANFFLKGALPDQAGVRQHDSHRRRTASSRWSTGLALPRPQTEFGCVILAVSGVAFSTLQLFPMAIGTTVT